MFVLAGMAYTFTWNTVARNPSDTGKHELLYIFYTCTVNNVCFQLVYKANQSILSPPDLKASIPKTGKRLSNQL